MTALKNGLHQHTPSLAVIEPRGLSVRSIAYQRWDVDEAIAERIQRQVLLTESVDAGWRLACHDAAGQPLSEARSSSKSMRFSRNGGRRTQQP